MGDRVSERRIERERDGRYRDGVSVEGGKKIDSKGDKMREIALQSVKIYPILNIPLQNKICCLPWCWVPTSSVRYLVSQIDTPIKAVL